MQNTKVDQDEEVVYFPAATGIAQVDRVPIEPFLDCRNIAASVEFYTKVLDFDLVVAPDPDPQQFGSRYAAVSRDGDMLHLSSHSRENGAFGASVYVRVENVDELCRRFVENGVELSVPDGGKTPVNQSWGMREIGFRDPDGNKLTFGQAIA
ncbi:MAG: VOC family protein [Pseudomonadota bacterium]